MVLPLMMGCPHRSKSAAVTVESRNVIAADDVADDCRIAHRSKSAAVRIGFILADGVAADYGLELLPQ